MQNSAAGLVVCWGFFEKNCIKKIDGALQELVSVANFGRNAGHAC
jgi:hypothetical protein